ncbi:class I SAM-dependent methyltransferase [Paenibacillus sp.]|uniref:class I SAM-dependent methyltransferase n=1 Tax=Paenibacillus sp. TaxID=58172 RepID=UPI002D592F56|nr:class I SAM-dependent methyltransferase [Paenibacillus sp.]HZG56507.1 class I SAM-dependent methyltransferase [Paenibacillus sp.]
MNEPWYERSFREDYLVIYKHRDVSGAEHEVRAMSSWLRLQEGASVLDLCCGTGRHSVVLDALGYAVVGVDLSETLLAEAREREDNAVRWVRGDMRRVPLDGPFDAVLNMFTSFGYFESDAENERVLAEIRRLLRPGGRYVIDFLNPSYVLANLVPHSTRRDGDLTIDERRAVRDGYVVKTITVSEKDAAPRSYEERVKLYGLPAFEGMLARVGLSLDAVYGDYDGSAYDEPTSKRLILVGHRGEKEA